jgi:hypothetical protein
LSKQFSKSLTWVGVAGIGKLLCVHCVLLSTIQKGQWNICTLVYQKLLRWLSLWLTLLHQHLELQPQLPLHLPCLQHLLQQLLEDLMLLHWTSSLRFDLS